MKIYFAGSIRGGRTDAALYQRMIEAMKRHNHLVLTEHIGDLSLSMLEQKEDADERIYQQDIAWLLESDILIAECTCPSLGVGYELAYAEAHEKPVHIFYNSERSALSAMLRGNSYFKVHPYATEEQLFDQLEEIIS